MSKSTDIQMSPSQFIDFVIKFFNYTDQALILIAYFHQRTWLQNKFSYHVSRVGTYGRSYN